MHPRLYAGILSLVIFFICSAAHAQRIAPAAYGMDVKVNYVRTWEVKVPESNSSNLTVASTLDKAVMTTQYLDGLGRPIQTVVKGITPSGKDLVTPVVYDAFGQEEVKYLPFAANATGGNLSVSNGGFKLNPFQQDSAFSKMQYSGESHFYSQVFFEASPLGRVLESFAPGDNWAGTAGQTQAAGRRSVKTSYLINTVSDSVRIWVASANISTAPTTSARYAAGELYKTITTDEHGKQVVEYKDKEERVVLKKVQLATSPGSAHIGWLCTYYVYDDLGQVRFVMQPQAVALMLSAGNWTITTTQRDELCFYYGYDGRGRMNIKKVPGAGEVHLVYDGRDRLVMTQDANMRSTGKWLVTIYDELNRPIKTGLYANTSSRTTQQAAADNLPAAAYPFTNNTPPSTGWDLLTETGYDNYTNLPGVFSANASTSNIASAFNNNHNQAPDYPQPFSQSFQTKGLVTWTRTRILDSTGFLSAVNYYDEQGRLIQVRNQNILGGIDEKTVQYGFSGQVLRTIEITRTGQTMIVFTRNSYDKQLRLINIEKIHSSPFGTYKPIARMEYNELGQLKKKVLGSNLDSLEYEYNIRGWLLGANRDYAKSLTNNTHYFGFDLGYDKTSLAANGGSAIGSYATASYNGNIAGTVWKSKGDNEIRKYDFAYDAVNRLTKADFTQYTGGFNKTAGLDFSVSNISYDANGNILSQMQRAWKLGGSIDMDRLRYNYQPQTNKLIAVVDTANDNSSRLGDFKYDPVSKTTQDYAYDGNGNLTSDANKKLSSILYNHLNLPSRVLVNGKGVVRYIYDASGNKLKKITTDSTGASVVIKTTTYIGGGGTVYESVEHTALTVGDYINKFLFTSHEEGRIRLDYQNFSFPYDYFLKDHLGNVRMVLTNEAKTDSYPAATMETASINTESTYYGNLVNTQYPKPSWYSDPLYTSNAQVSRLRNATGSHKVGQNMLLKVMAGDQYNIRATSGWSSGSAANNRSASVLSDLLSLLSGSAAGLSGGKVTQAELQSSSSGLTMGLSSFMSSQTSSGTKPKAYINWILLDEQFKVVPGSSGFEQVGASGTTTIHTKAGLTVAKSGYLYIYTSNEATNIDVFFDNLQVTHIRGPILEETHYYPFGLTMAGISSKAAGSLLNRYKFNDGTELSNQEFSDGSGLELYETPFRGYDQQIGRFWQVDAMASDYEAWSPYVFSFNNPINLNDPSGLATDSLKAPDGGMVADKGAMETVTVKYSPKSKMNLYWWASFVDANKHNDYSSLHNTLKEQGVNEKGLRLFNEAWKGIGYRERLAEIEAGWREFVQDALIEGGIFIVGGGMGKAVSVGFRLYKLNRTANISRVFWNTGGKGGNVLIKVAAENFAKMNGGMTLNMTLSGRALEFVSPILPKSISTHLWNRLSSSFARNAIGEVHVFQNATSGVNMASTWVKYEFPNLNLSRVSINYHY